VSSAGRDPAAVRWMRDTGRGRAGRRRWSERRPVEAMPAAVFCFHDGWRHGVARGDSEAQPPVAFRRWGRRLPLAGRTALISSSLPLVQRSTPAPDERTR
jgi:hypothetical protein